MGKRHSRRDRSGAKGVQQSGHTCPHCDKRPRRADNLARHLAEAHPDAHIAPVLDRRPAGYGAPGPSGAGGAPVDHSLSGAPDQPFWDWDPQSAGHRARMAKIPIEQMGLPAAVVREHAALMDFIDTECAPVLRAIDETTARRPPELAVFEAKMHSFEELMFVNMILHEVLMFTNMQPLLACLHPAVGSAPLGEKASGPAGTGRATRPRRTRCGTCSRAPRSVRKSAQRSAGTCTSTATGPRTSLCSLSGGLPSSRRPNGRSCRSLRRDGTRRWTCTSETCSFCSRACCATRSATRQRTWCGDLRCTRTRTRGNAASATWPTCATRTGTAANRTGPQGGGRPATCFMFANMSCVCMQLLCLQT